MRIAIDARELVGRATGVGRYLSELLTAWDRMPEAADLEVHLLAHTSIPTLQLPNLRVTTRVGGGAGGTWWEQATLPSLVRAASPQVLFAPGYTAPLRLSVPSVVTVHDVSYCAHPEWFSWREGTRRRVLTRLAARRATTVVTVSNFSKEEIVRHLGVPPSRVRVIYSGPSGLPVDGAPGDPPPREPLVLYVGSILARRHVPELVAGFARLARRRADVRLVLVGEPRGTPAVDVVGALRAADLGDRVAHLGFVDDATLARLYRRASAFAFLSAYEGFGLTPLDALQAGVPPIVLDTAVAREVLGGAAHFVSHPEPALIEAALDRVLRDPRERERLAAEARTRLGRLTWRESARQTFDALREAAG